MIDPELEFQSIAIIGMTGQFSGAANLTEYWHNITHKRPCIDRLSLTELSRRKVPAERYNDPRYVNCDTSLSGMEWFDAGLFDMSAREANATDPQHRLLLEHCHRLLRQIAVEPGKFAGDVGLFAGAGMSQYLLHNLINQPDIMAYPGEGTVEIGNYLSYSTTRVAHKLNLCGPVMALDTACSSSLVSTHLACKSLLNFECDIALAGGVQLNLPQHSGYLYNEGSFHSADGHCYTFDARANGTVFCSGVGVIALKRVEDAVNDGDRIIAMIKGSAVNNDGSDKVGYTAPAAAGQTDVIRKARIFADITAESIGYVEAHGTATSLGDLIEFSALCEAWGDAPARSCALGSVKPNIGHCETAAGIAGLIKAALALEHRRLPPNIQFERHNHQIDFVNSPFYVNTEDREWLRGDEPRRAGVSSFGIGGANAHIILEEVEPEPTQASTIQRPQLLMFSAVGREALDLLRDNAAEWLGSNPAINLADWSWSLEQGSRTYSHRHFVVAESVEDARNQLSGAPRSLALGSASREKPQLVFMFPGQGAQQVGMAAALYQRSTVFRDVLDECAQLLEPMLQVDIIALVYGDGDTEVRQKQLNDTAITQPVLFAIEYALARQWIDLGIEPDMMIGHSLGEYVAACLANVFDLPTALKLVVGRGRVIQKCKTGDMLAVAADVERTGKIIEQLAGQMIPDECCDLAAINALDSCVVSGSSDAIKRLAATCYELDIKTHYLQTSHAFHSSMMEACLAEFEQLLCEVDFYGPQRRFISNLSADWITDEQATSVAYWCRHLRETVNFNGGLSTILAESNTLLLEVGPGRQLSQLALRQDKVSPDKVVSTLGDDGHQAADAAFMEATGRLWMADVQIDWQGFFCDEHFGPALNGEGEPGIYRKLPLPEYPYQRKRYWVEPVEPNSVDNGKSANNDQRQPLSDWFYLPQWQRSALPGHLQLRDNEGPLRDCPILLVDDNSRLADTLHQVLRKAGAHVNRLEEPGGPRTLEHWREYFKQIADKARLPVQVIYMANEGDEVPLEKGFYRLLYLAQAMAEYSNFNCHICAVTSGVHDVCGDLITQPLLATLYGLTKVLSQEVSSLDCCQLDVAVDADATAAAGQIVDELELGLKAGFTSEGVIPSPFSLPDLVALRNGYRWVRCYEHFSPPIVDPQALTLKKGGVYLIVGGFGGLGRTFAQYLAREYQATLVLTTREALPPKNQWHSHLEDHNSKWHEAVRFATELERVGGDVHSVAIDLSCADSIEMAVAKMREEVGHPSGAIHAAGVAGSGIALMKTADLADMVLTPKVCGAWHLYNQLATEHLDFLVLNSSLFAVTGGVGQVDYCAANAALDSLAAYARQQGVRAFAINWDGWQQVGMAARLAGWDSSLGITPQEGVDVLKHVLLANQPQVVLATRKLDRVIEQAMTPLDSAVSLEVSERPEIETAFKAPLTDTEHQISEIWRKYLGLSSVGTNDNFFELGGNSLLLSEVLSDLNRTLDRKLTIADLFKHTSIGALATFLHRDQPEDMDVDAIKLDAQQRREKRKRRRGG
ncbi:beta-ketoacyl synthase N-terminal-like domain-containing protein [Microbulbifer sp. 2304DJ12-6]|uniref:type I polyketide synthase n=1 Tax=Microbulbifer sp. 2304DJ12-6 TaxID=3233340 RepID=UPI0039AEE514